MCSCLRSLPRPRRDHQVFYEPFPASVTWSPRPFQSRLSALQNQPAHEEENADVLPLARYICATPLLCSDRHAVVGEGYEYENSHYVTRRENVRITHFPENGRSRCIKGMREGRGCDDRSTWALRVFFLDLLNAVDWV